MKTLFIAARIFALLNLCFVPAIAVAVVVAFVSGERWWFTFIALPAFIINGIIVFANPARTLIWRYVSSIAGPLTAVTRR